MQWLSATAVTRLLKLSSYCIAVIGLTNEGKHCANYIHCDKKVNLTYGTYVLPNL